MKKILMTLCLLAGIAFGASAQKFALINMDYVLRNLPDYEMANEQLNQVSQRWEKEIVALQKEAETMYKNYQADMVFLTQEQQSKRAEEVAAKEKEVAELRNKYFGPEGELYKKRQSLMKPIQENVYNAVKAVAEERKYQVIFDRASSQSIVFASPTIDVSNDVLAKLGFAK
ncbi:MAG: OmpH family outer membrane protein [Muribaculaceae bacterium]|nr:OmpH family outer membrane protein [Muribaculaceae bacterium]